MFVTFVMYVAEFDAIAAEEVARSLLNCFIIKLSDC